MLDLIRKRHDGPAWIVVEELANTTGSNVRGFADAFAIGLWPSRGYEIHGYEIKVSRGDVQRELRDPSKADAIGKYCDFWWLAVSDLKIIDGLIIPESWGILHPVQRVLRVHRKAPKRDATPVNRGFCAALIRKVSEGWVPKHVHDELKKNALAEATKELERTREYRTATAELELKQLQARVSAFEEAAGVSISNVHAYEVGDIGSAVKAVMTARELAGKRHNQHWGTASPATLVESELRSLERLVAQHRAGAENAKAAASRVQAYLDEIKRGAEPGQATLEGIG